MSARTRSTAATNAGVCLSCHFRHQVDLEANVLSACTVLERGIDEVGPDAKYPWLQRRQRTVGGAGALAEDEDGARHPGDQGAGSSYHYCSVHKQ